MEYKFFTDYEANYISEIFKGTNTIKKNNFEKEFYNLHYDELIKGRRGEEWINDAEKEKGLTDNQFLITKVKALNHGIGCLNYFNGNDIDDRKDTLLDVIRNRYKDDENYIKLLSYILLSSSPKRIDNIEKLDLFIDDLIEILNDKDIKKYYIENYDYLKGKELKEKEDKERKIKIDSVIDSINKENKKYKLSEFRRDIFSDTIATLQKEGKINSLLNDEKIKIFKIWSDCIVKHENFYAIIGEIKKYCNNIGKDYTMALYSIYLKNQHHYYCRYSDYDTTEYYYERGSLMNVLYRRIEKKYNGEIDIEDDMAKIFNILDNNTDNNDGYFDITTAKEQKVSVFFCFDIDIIRKLNSYTLLLEEEIEKEIEKINPQNQNKEYVNFEYLIKDKEKNITEIHNLATEKDVLDCTLIDFLQAIKDADFSSLNIKKLAKTKFLIYRLSLILDDKWYTQICKNMNFKKEQCSGANINNSDYFKKQIINLTTN